MTTMVWEPADGIAIARCQLARVRDRAHRETTDHASACGWCDYPDDALTTMLEGFNRWAGYDARSNSYAAHEVRRFYDQPRDEQRAAIEEAQGLTGQPWPVPSTEREPDERPGWLR